MATDGAAGAGLGPREMAIDTGDARVYVIAVQHVLRVILVTLGAQSIGDDRRPRLLAVHFMAVAATHANLSMAARLPLLECTGMAGSTQFRRGGNRHRRFGMGRPIRAMTGFATDAGQHELPRGCVVTRGMTGKTLVGLFGGFEVEPEDRVERRLGVDGARPGFVLVGMALAATVRALVYAENREAVSSCRRSGDRPLQPGPDQCQRQRRHDDGSSEGHYQPGGIVQTAA